MSGIPAESVEHAAGVQGGVAMVEPALGATAPADAAMVVDRHREVWGEGVEQLG